MDAIDCCFNSGSRVYFSVNGVPYALRASVTVRPSRKSTESMANADGSHYTTTKAELAEMDITLSDHCGLDIDELMNCTLDVTAELIDIRRTYIYSRSRIVGRPEIRTETGEITGLKVASAYPRVVNG